MGCGPIAPLSQLQRAWWSRAAICLSSWEMAKFMQLQDFFDRQDFPSKVPGRIWPELIGFWVQLIKGLAIKVNDTTFTLPLGGACLARILVPGDLSL